MPTAWWRLVDVYVIAAAVLLAGGCASLASAPCARGEQGMVSETLYFGTAMPRGVVAAQDWEAFLRAVVTPRFPEGFTRWRAAGQWRSADGNIIGEDSYVVSIVHADDEAAERSVRAIVAEYKMRFEQEAVLRVRSRSCVSF